MKRFLWLLLVVSCSSGPEPDVTSSYPYGRYLGALQLANRPGAETSRELVRMLEDPDALARSGAVVAMGRLRDPGFAQHLVPHLSPEKEKSGLVRSDVCIALGRLKSPDAVEPLLETLKSDEDPVVRREAARAAAEFGADPRMVLGLVRALRDPDASVSWRAEVSLRLKKNPSQDVIDVILSGLKNPDEKVRAGAADAIALAGRASLAAWLVPVKDSSAFVRGRKCRALGILKAPETIPALGKALKDDPDPGVRGAAASALSHFSRSGETVTALLSALEDSDTRVQARAHQALIILTGAREVERNRTAWERHLKAHP
jgi:HEAT repeat protein